jgi:hypothetical protein
LTSAAPSTDSKLHAQSCLEAVDAVTGHQFEFYYAQLLESLGWARIQVIGDKSGGDGGADILATYPRNRDFAIQCKRYAPAKAVAIGDVRELNGALAHEHPNRLGMIVTTGRRPSLPSDWPQGPASGRRPPGPRKPDGPRARHSCPWTPQHGGLQRDKVTHDGTEKERPASTRYRS